MRDLPQKPKEVIKSLADVKVLFPELASEMEAVVKASPNFGEKIILGLIHEVIGQINNRKGALKLNPNGIDLPSSIEMIQQFGAVRIPMDLIPEETKAREEFLKDKAGKSQTHTAAMLVTILMGKFESDRAGASKDAYEPYKDLATTKAMSDLCNKLTDLTEKEMLGYNVSIDLRSQFIAMDKELKEKTGYEFGKHRLDKDKVERIDPKERRQILGKYFGVLNKIKAEIKNGDSMNQEVKKRFLDEINADVSNKVASEIVLMLKGNTMSARFEEKYDGRIEAISKAFGEQIQKQKRPRLLLSVLQVVINKMNIDAVDDLVNKPNKDVFERVINSPVIAGAASEIISDSKNYRNDLIAVMNVVKEVLEEKVDKEKIQKCIGDFKEILSNGKGGVDPEAVKFFQILGNATNWAKALEVDPECFSKLGVAGERFATPEAKKWVKNLIDHPKEHKALFSKLRVKGEVTLQTLRDGNKMAEGFHDMMQYKVPAVVRDDAMKATKDNPEKAEVHVNRVMEINLDKFAEGYRLLCTTESLEGVTKPDNSKLVAEFVSRSALSHKHVESIYNKLHETKIQKADFKDMLAIHGDLFEKFEKAVDPKNINSAMDAVFKLAEVRGVFYGSAITKDSMNAVINSKEFDKFIVVMNKDPELGKIILDEVKKIGGLSLAQRAEAFNAIHDGMHVSTKVKDGERIRADIKKVIAASTTGFFSKQVHVDKLEENMKAVKADLAVYSKDVLSERGKKYYNEGEKAAAVKDIAGNSMLGAHVQAIKEQGLKFDLINKHGKEMAKPKNLDSLRKGHEKLHSDHSDRGRGA